LQSKLDQAIKDRDFYEDLAKKEKQKNKILKKAFKRYDAHLHNEDHIKSLEVSLTPAGKTIDRSKVFLTDFML
jgi:hypothetical protein